MAKNLEQLGVVPGLVRSAFLVDAVYAEASRDHGLTAQQGQLLCVLMARSYGMGELGSVLRLAKSSLSGLIDRSERNGLVRRDQDGSDSRAVRVTLTPSGQALASTFYDDACRRLDRLADGLSTRERSTLAALLGRIITENEAPAVFLEPGELGDR